MSKEPRSRKRVCITIREILKRPSALRRKEKKALAEGRERFGTLPACQGTHMYGLLAERRS